MLNMEALDVPPSGTDAFLWADFAEMRALIHPDQSFSHADLESISNRRQGMRDKSEEEDEDEGQDAGGYRLKSRGFNVKRRWMDITDSVGHRQLDFGDCYPFELSDDKDTILVRKKYMTKSEKIYLVLLVASSLRLVNHKRWDEITRAFEMFSFQIFSCLMPLGSEIRATWANGGLEAPYKGSLYDKMLSICEDIRGKPNFEQRDFKRNDKGDGKIDLIAWHPMADTRDNIPIAFAQCGCSKDEWQFKQLEASPGKLASRLTVGHDWATYYFLPLDLRWSDGDWAYKFHIGKAIIVDRLRLIRLGSQYKLHKKLPNMNFIKEVIDFRYCN